MRTSDDYTPPPFWLAWAILGVSGSASIITIALWLLGITK